MSKVKDAWEIDQEEFCKAMDAYDEMFITVPRGEFEQMQSELEDLRNMKRVIEARYDPRWKKKEQDGNETRD